MNGSSQVIHLILLLLENDFWTAASHKGIGQALLKDALLRTLQAADIVGIRAFAVHAKDDEARVLNRHFDFIESPSDPMHLFLLLKDIKALIA